MRRSLPIFLVVPLFVPTTVSAEERPKPVAAVVETTLTTDAEQIRQLAFDGDAKTYFASAKNAVAADHFTLVFDKPVAVKSIVARTGKPDGDDKLDAGVLEVSADGKRFERLAAFEDGSAHAALRNRKIQAIRIKTIRDLKHPLILREIIVESTPTVQVFQYPVEFRVDASDAPAMREWAEKVGRLCERQYAMINEELKSDGFTPPRLVKMSLKTSYKGVAFASGGGITGSAAYFKAHPDDVGAMVHETAHIVQNYRTRGNPGWLVEGIADYVRFFKYEAPGKIGRIGAKRARYNGSYRVTAAFLAYLANKYDKQIVRKLNKMMREGEYKEEAFKTLTGKTVQQLDKEWRATLED